MWIDPTADGCVYDTIDCYHTCRGCEYGIDTCDVCGQDVYYNEGHICEEE